MSWYLIETLFPPTMSVVFQQGHTRSWSSIQTLRRSEGIDDVGGMCHAVITSGSGFDRVVTGRQGQRRVLMVPLVGFGGVVYGIKTWVGRTDGQVSPEPSVAAVHWDPQELLGRHTASLDGTSSSLSILDTEAPATRPRDPGRLLSRVIHCDPFSELTEFLMGAGACTRFSGHFTVLNGKTDTSVADIRVWRGIAKRQNSTPDAVAVVRGLLHDVTDSERPQVSPMAAMRLTELETHCDQERSAVVLIAYRADSFASHKLVPSLFYWVTRRPAYVASVVADRSPVPGSLIHPEDYEKFGRAKHSLNSSPTGATVPLCVRLLSSAHTWVRVKIMLQRYPGAVGDHLHVARILHPQ